jgi:hypothetical protein
MILRRSKDLFRAELPRLYELRDCTPNLTSSDAYFRGFNQNLARFPEAKDYYQRLEQVLRGPDDQAWQHLKEKACQYHTQRDKKGRGWSQLICVLNEARGYNYLKSLGCTNLHFIPESTVRTPDLEGLLASRLVLCEVKTVNISDQEVAFRTGRKKVRQGQITLPAQFLKKLRATVEAARQQLLAFGAGRAADHFVYVYVDFDDIVGYFKERHFKQIDDDLAQAPFADIRLVICNDHTPSYKPLQMRFAEVDNDG